MKKIFLIIVTLFCCSVSPFAEAQEETVPGSLYVKVPADELEQMLNRIKTLESESGKLKTDIQIMGTPSEELETRISELEREKRSLQEQVRSLEESSPAGTVSPELKSRLSALESENNNLKEQVKALETAPASATDEEVKSRISKMDRANRRLKRQVQSLKEGVIATSLGEDRRTARHVYSPLSLKSSNHIYK